MIHVSGYAPPRPFPEPLDSMLKKVIPAVPCPAIPETRESLAHHEAGHVVVSLELGLPCESAFIGDTKGGFSTHFALKPDQMGAMSDAESVSFHALAVKVAKPLADESNRVIDLVTVLMAGVQAQLFHAGQPLAGMLVINDHDTRQARLLLAGAGHPATLGYCQLRARALLSQQWAQVQSIAAILGRDGAWQR